MRTKLYINFKDVTNPVFLQLYFPGLPVLQIFDDFMSIPYQVCCTSDRHIAKGIVHYDQATSEFLLRIFSG